MPPKKRSAPTTRSKSKRPWTSELTEETAESITTPPPQNLMTVDVQALSATLSLAVTQAVQLTLGQVNQAPPPLSTEVVEASVQDEVSVITEGAPINSQFTAQLLSLPANREPFASIVVTLGSRVSPKLKAKIWANEFIEFGSLLTSSINQDRYSVCLTPSSNPSNQPRLTLEPCQSSKKIHKFLQWLSAFNICVAILSERFPNETPRLMKYSEIILDISTKPGDWYFYDKQFRYIRKSAPEQYPWNTIHWELWLQAVINFRAKPAQLKPDIAYPRTRPRQSFSKGTCWSFHAGKYCGGYKFEHICFKRGAKHPASQCSVVNRRRAALPKTSSNLTHSVAHVRKGGLT